jgi:hypothetical protein
MTAAANPVGAMMVSASHDKPVTTFDIRPGCLQLGQRLIMKGLRPGHVAKGMTQPENRIVSHHSVECAPQIAVLPIILGGEERAKRGNVGGMA